MRADLMRMWLSQRDASPANSAAASPSDRKAKLGAAPDAPDANKQWEMEAWLKLVHRSPSNALARRVEVGENCRIVDEYNANSTTDDAKLSLDANGDIVASAEGTIEVNGKQQELRQYLLAKDLRHPKEPSTRAHIEALTEQIHQDEFDLANHNLQGAAATQARGRIVHSEAVIRELRQRLSEEKELTALQIRNDRDREVRRIEQIAEIRGRSFADVARGRRLGFLRSLVSGAGEPLYRAADVVRLGLDREARPLSELGQVSKIEAEVYGQNPMESIAPLAALSSVPGLGTWIGTLDLIERVPRGTFDRDAAGELLGGLALGMLMGKALAAAGPRLKSLGPTLREIRAELAKGGLRTTALLEAGRKLKMRAALRKFNVSRDVLQLAADLDNIKGWDGAGLDGLVRAAIVLIAERLNSSHHNIGLLAGPITERGPPEVQFGGLPTVAGSVGAERGVSRAPMARAIVEASPQQRALAMVEQLQGAIAQVKRHMSHLPERKKQVRTLKGDLAAWKRRIKKMDTKQAAPRPMRELDQIVNELRDAAERIGYLRTKTRTSAQLKVLREAIQLGRHRLARVQAAIDTVARYPDRQADQPELLIRMSRLRAALEQIEAETPRTIPRWVAECEALSDWMVATQEDVNDILNGLGALYADTRR